jgi:hypothetical protein
MSTNLIGHKIVILNKSFFQYNASWTILGVEVVFLAHLGGCFKTEVSPSWLNNRLKKFKFTKMDGCSVSSLHISSPFVSPSCSSSSSKPFVSLSLFPCIPLYEKTTFVLSNRQCPGKNKKETGNGISELWFLGLSVF